MKKVIISLLTSVLPVVSFAQNEKVEIRTVEQLAAIANDDSGMRGEYILMNDLVADNWIPIGTIEGKNKRGFSGTFDGNGHTITINSFDTQQDRVCVGLFGLTEAGSLIKNLRVAGQINYVSGRKFMYIGGIAGFNNGSILYCISSVDLTCNYADTGNEAEKVKAQSPYEAGQYGGCIAGINLGVILYSYSDGSICLPRGYAAGISAGNGRVVKGGIGIGIGSGGVSVSATPGAMPLQKNGIGYCYSTASVSAFFASGIVVINRPETCVVTHSVALNRLIESIGSPPVPLNRIVEIQESAALATPYPHSAAGITHPNTNFYFSDNIVIRQHDARLKPVQISPKRAVAFSATQDESWWQMPEGLSKKEKRRVLGFTFGHDETAPWKWNDQLKRPVLYWETDEVAG